MPISQAKADILANQYLQGKSYAEIGLAAGYKDSPHIRTTIYDTLQSPTVQDAIAQKVAKKHSVDELQSLTSNTIDKVTKYIESTEIDPLNVSDVVKVIDKQKDFIELAGRFQGAFIDKSMIISIDTTLDELDTRANQLLQGTPEQGKEEGKTD